MTYSPTVTVLMPVYNSENYLEEAIQSIFLQSFKDYEVLIINDGSTDKTEKILNRMRNKRVRILRNESNAGLIHSLNKGLKNSRGKYVARMDSDDIMYTHRLKYQTEFLNTNSQIDICGCNIATFGEGVKTSIIKYPSYHDDIKCELLRWNPIAHPTTMFRRDKVIQTGELFRSEYISAEDYDLFERLSHRLRFANLNKVLLKYRIHKKQISQDKKEEMDDSAKTIRHRQLLRVIPEISFEKQQLHEKSIDFGKQLSVEELVQVEKWLCYLAGCMNNYDAYNTQAIVKFVDSVWLNACNRTKFSFKLWMKYVSSDLRLSSLILNKNEWKLFIKCVTRFFN